MTAIVVVHLIIRSAVVTGRIGALGFRWGREAEVLGVVAQEHTESARTVVPPACRPDYRALQSDLLALTAAVCARLQRPVRGITSSPRHISTK